MKGISGCVDGALEESACPFIVDFLLLLSRINGRGMRTMIARLKVVRLAVGIEGRLRMDGRSPADVSRVIMPVVNRTLSPCALPSGQMSGSVSVVRYRVFIFVLVLSLPPRCGEEAFLYLSLAPSTCQKVLLIKLQSNAPGARGIMGLIYWPKITSHFALSAGNAGLISTLVMFFPTHGGCIGQGWLRRRGYEGTCKR